jgi:acetoin utilization deacetylase AcuC-like enzyme
LRLAHQNDLKISKTYYFKAKKKKIQIFSEALLKSTPKQALNKMAQSMWLVKNLAHMHTQTYVMNLWARI